MNLSESLKFVIKNKGQDIANDLWKEDLRNLLSELSFKINPPKKWSLKTLKDPFKIKRGLRQFQEEFLFELERLPDARDKSIFVLKVFTSLSTYLLSELYDISKIRGSKKRWGMTQLLLADLVLKVGRVYVLRFLDEIELLLTDPEELKKVRFFRHMLHSHTTEEMSLDSQEVDRAQEIVDTLGENLLSRRKNRHAQ